MHSVDMLERAMACADRLGYGIRQEYLGGVGGGGCEIAGKKWIFIDVALSTQEQLQQVIETLQADPGWFQLELPPEWREAFEFRLRAA